MFRRLFVPVIPHTYPDAYSPGLNIGERGSASLAHSEEFVLDLYCGTATSASLYYLLSNPRARVIGVDKYHDEGWVRSHLPSQV